MKTEKPLVPQGPVLLAPVSKRLVFGTLLLGFLANLLPWPDGARWLVPDFTLVALLYWSIHAPHVVRLGLATLLGLLTDAALGNLIGLHGLTYTLSAYAAIVLRRRLENFQVAGRALHLLPIFFGQQLLTLLLGLAFHEPDVDWRFLISGVVAAVAWIPMAHLLDHLTGWTPEMHIEPAEASGRKKK